MVRGVAFVRLAVDFRQIRFAHRLRGNRQTALASLGHADEAAIVSHVGADEIGHTAIAAQKSLRAGESAAGVDHGLGRVTHRARWILARQETAELAVAKHLSLRTLWNCATGSGKKAGGERKCDCEARHEKLLRRQAFRAGLVWQAVFMLSTGL
ncbi:MAG: hypothetical protein WD845_12850 [Pirellulales bacterium]